MPGVLDSHRRGHLPPGGVVGYPLDQLYEEVAFISYNLHRPLRDIHTLEHAAFVEQYRAQFGSRVLSPVLPERTVIPESQRAEGWFVPASVFIGVISFALIRLLFPGH